MSARPSPSLIFCSLFVADSVDGSNERRVFSTSYPIRIGDNKISPDGKSVVFAVGQSETQGNDFGLMQVDIETDNTRELTSERFFNIMGLAWLPDRDGLIISASKTPTKRYRLWFMPSGGREPTPLTQDSESYTSLSVDNSADAMVSVQTRQSYQLHLFMTDSPQKSRILADATSVAFTSDNRILFTSMMSGNDEIWSINADGSGQRQLTNNQADENAAIASPDNGSVFFASNRTGKIQVWKMNADGSNQTQVTFGQGGSPLKVSPDGRWIYYHHALDKTLWRVSVDGGEEQLILDRREHHLALSHDCTMLAIAEMEGADHVLTIVRIDDGKVVRTIRPADPRAELLNLEWSADGRELWYVSATGEYENNKLWKHSLDSGAAQKIADLGDDRITAFGFALSPGGKNFAIAKGRWSHDAVLLRSSK